MSRRKRKEVGEPVIVDGQVVGFQLPIPDPDEEPNRAHTRRRKQRQAPAETQSNQADS